MADFIADFLGDSVARPLRVVEAPGHAFADARRKPNATTDKYVSLINRASIAALEETVETPVDPLRFRANVYFDGAPAWRELDWIGSQLMLGAARLRVIAAITRCAATEVNPETAERDLAIVAALRQNFGHNLMGIYAEVTEGGPDRGRRQVWGRSRFRSRRRDSCVPKSSVAAPQPLGGVGHPDQRKSRKPVSPAVGGRSTQMQLPDDFDAVAGQHPRRDRFERRPIHSHSTLNVSQPE